MDSQSPGLTTIPHKLITILVALYEAGPFLRAKLQNLERLHHFDKCWVVLLNCENKHNEADLYTDYLSKYPNMMARQYNSYVSLYTSWNDGIMATNSTYIMNSNVDDMLHPAYVELCTDYLENNPDIAVVSSRVAITDEPNRVWPNWNSSEDMPFHAFPDSTAGPCPVWRRSLHAKYGMFDGRCRVIADGLIWEKWHEGGEKFGLLDKRLALYYRNPTSLERRRDEDGETFITKDKRKIREAQ